jgi:toxin secretion/phage lysis holin
MVGGDDKLIRGLIGVIIFDYITGLLKAIYLKQLSSEIGLKGIVKKIMIICLVASSVIAGETLGNNKIHDIVIMFFFTNEFISIIENGATMLPIPESIKKFFLQLRDKTSIGGLIDGKIQ